MAKGRINFFDPSFLYGLFNIILIIGQFNGFKWICMTLGIPTSLLSFISSNDSHKKIRSGCKT